MFRAGWVPDNYFRYNDATIIARTTDRPVLQK